MRTILMILVLGLSLTAQKSSEPYPGQSNHKKPPDGWFCQHQNFQLSVPPAHVCKCERVCDNENGMINEDRSCTVYCHKQHCHCGVGNLKACK